MAPKKKIPVKAEGTTEEVSKPVEVPVPPVEQKKEQIRVQIKAPQQHAQTAPSTTQQELKKEESASENKPTTKILTTQPLPLSEQEKLRLRKLRFSGTIGTDVIPQEAERIKKQRIQKFGGSLNEPLSKEEIQRRKAKFGGQVAQDQETLKKRRQKFSASSSLIANEDKSVLQERKKKFGGEKAISLDDQIQKTKQIHKNKSKHQLKGRGHNNKQRGGRN